jgi:hypothetical protein
LGSNPDPACDLLVPGVLVLGVRGDGPVNYMLMTCSCSACDMMTVLRQVARSALQLADRVLLAALSRRLPQALLN